MSIASNAGPEGISLSLLNDSTDSTKLLRIYFTGIGLSSDKSSTFKLLNIVINVLLWALFILTLEFAVFNIVGRGDQVEFYVVGVILFYLEACIIYTAISYNMRGEDTILSFIKDISQLEDSQFGQYYTKNSATTRNCDLRSVSIFWVSITVACVLTSIIPSVLAFGAYGMTHTLYPFVTNRAAALVFVPLLIVLNFSIPASMIIVRVGCFFARKRILAMIEFMEDFLARPQSEAFPVTDVMGWYDNLYRLNRRLSRALGPFVTISILIGLPHSIFLLQVSPVK
jgi:hypothetical protein